MKNHVNFAKRLDVLWSKLDRFDGNYIHHSPQRFMVMNDLSDNDILFLSGSTNVCVSRVADLENRMFLRLDQLHKTKQQAWHEWIRLAEINGMRSEFIEKAKYIACGDVD